MLTTSRNKRISHSNQDIFQGVRGDTAQKHSPLYHSMALQSLNTHTLARTQGLQSK